MPPPSPAAGAPPETAPVRRDRSGLAVSRPCLNCGQLGGGGRLWSARPQGWRRLCCARRAPMPYRDRARYRPPGRSVARVNRAVAWLAACGLTPRDTVALEVPGRRTGRRRRTAVVWAERKGHRYLVSLAGEAEWVRNVRAAHHEATIRRGRARKVRLEEVPVDRRAPILKAYLSKRAYSKSSRDEAREFFGVPPNASLDELAAIADHYPVFRIVGSP